MCAHILNGQGQSSDMDLLQDFSGMLNIITDSQEEKSYNRRLYQLSLVVIDVMSAKESQYKRRKKGSNLEQQTAVLLPQPDHTSLRIARSDTFPPSNSNYSHITPDLHTTPDVREAKDQSLDYAAFPDSDDSFNLVDPIVPMNSESGQSSADELNSNLGSYANMLLGNIESLSYGLESSREDFGEREM